MRLSRSGWGLGLGIAVLLAGVIGACGSDGNADPSNGGPTGFGGDLDGGENASFDVQPRDLQTITVPFGQQAPTVAYTATAADGQPVKVQWNVDRSEVGSVNAGPDSGTIFTPAGRAGGLVTVVARLGEETVERQIMVKVVAEQNGATTDQSDQVAKNVPSLTEGGGIGGVGGEGLGVAVTDEAVKGVLASPSSNGSEQQLTFLYPYADTVFPRGMLAPLLMWDWSLGDVDAIRLTLETTSGAFSWTGTFGRPEILTTTKGKFIRHPIPQNVWKTATETAGSLLPDGSRDRLTVKLTIARNGVGYGPISQTFTIAPGKLSGRVYYSSYGTRYAKNYTGAVGGDGAFGGATLGIRIGETAPKLVAGANGNSSQCRVCHSVASNGSRLVTVRFSDDESFAYDLTPTSATPHQMGVDTEYPALSPDGAIALTRNGKILELPNAATAHNTTGLAATDIGTPAFAQNGKLVAYNPMNTVQNAKQKLYVAAFEPSDRSFSNNVVVVDNTGSPAETRPGWPAFLPDSQSLVFHQQIEAGFEGNNFGDLHTRRGARAYIAWTSVTDATNVTPLDRLNGKKDGKVYLPKLKTPVSLTCTADDDTVGNIDTDHGDDVNLNYEPTVSPAPSGGYAWIVFTSRRLYGNLATIPPFCSDPRGVDLVTNITTKKLWVAAIDLSAKPGSDASHPAFYLPAQELLAGNTRGFWVLDACKQEGSDCESGDDCCGGYCKPNSSGALVCSSEAPQCAGIGDKCTTKADCCDSSAQCIGGFCRQSGPK